MNARLFDDDIIQGRGKFVGVFQQMRFELVPQTSKDLCQVSSDGILPGCEFNSVRIQLPHEISKPVTLNNIKGEII